MLADKLLNISERFVIELLADLLDIKPAHINNYFRESTGRDFPPMGDPSSKLWWEDLYARKSKSSNKQGQQQSDKSSPNNRRIQALAVLGLEEGATTEDIRQAYRLLARIHHPDRFKKVGQEAVNAASATFVRIKAAYEILQESSR